MLAEIIASE